MIWYLKPAINQAYYLGNLKQMFHLRTTFVKGIIQYKYMYFEHTGFPVCYIIIYLASKLSVIKSYYRRELGSKSAYGRRNVKFFLMNYSLNPLYGCETW